MTADGRDVVAENIEAQSGRVAGLCNMVKYNK